MRVWAPAFQNDCSASVFSKELLPAVTGLEEAGILEKCFFREVTLCWGSEGDEMRAGDSLLRAFQGLIPTSTYPGNSLEEYQLPFLLILLSCRRAQL